MNKRKLGRTNLHVSELCLNTTKFGWMNDEEASFVLLDAYRACGGTFLETLGAGPSPEASQTSVTHSEEVVGRWRHSRAIDRGSLVLASRMALERPAYGGGIAFTNRIRETCERSLRRLQTDHLDLVVCEWTDRLLPLDDVMEALDRLIRAGLVRYAVAGGFPPWRMVDSLHRAGLRDHARFEAVQNEYSLMTRARFEGEALAMCSEYRLGFLARSPLAGGFLAKRALAFSGMDHGERNWLDERFGNHSGDAVLRALGDIAESRLATPAQIALAWVLRTPVVTSALISPPTPDALRELARATSIALTDAEAETLARVTTVQDYRMELRHA